MTKQPALLVDEDDGDFVRALARGLSILETFDIEHPQMSLTEVAARVHMSRGSTRRLLLTLEYLGFVGVENGVFYLRPRVLKLGLGYLSSMPVWTAAQSVIQGVAAATDESCSVAVLDNAEIVYVARVASKRIINDFIAVGTRFAAHAASMGKVLLAALPPDEARRRLERNPPEHVTARTETDLLQIERELAETRRRGWAVNDEELEVGLRSIAVGIADSSGKTVAAINVSAPTARVSRSQLKNWLPILQEASSAISLLLASQPGSGAAL